jgi:hypothetical protein
LPPSIAATAEFVVPRSIPTTFSATTRNPLRRTYLCDEEEEDDDFTRKRQPRKPLAPPPLFNPSPKKELLDLVAPFLLVPSTNESTTTQPFPNPFTPKICAFTTVAAISCSPPPPPEFLLCSQNFKTPTTQYHPPEKEKKNKKIAEFLFNTATSISSCNSLPVYTFCFVDSAATATATKKRLELAELLLRSRGAALRFSTLLLSLYPRQRRFWRLPRGENPH